MNNYSVSIAPVFGVGFLGHNTVISDNSGIPIANVEYRAILVGFIIISFISITEL
jgi:hypothetical protein